MLEDKVISLTNGKKVKIVPFSGRGLYLDTSNIAFIIENKDEIGDIVSLTLEDKFTITVGDEFPIEVGDLDEFIKTVYKVRYMIVEKKGKSVIIYSALPTKSNLFLLPLLNVGKKDLMYDSYFVSAQLDLTYRFMCLMYRYTGSKTYKGFEQKMMVNPLCVSHLEHGPYHVVYIFKIPTHWKTDIETFIEGKYSKLSKALVERIKKFHGNKDSKPIIDIINQSADLRKALENYLGIELPGDCELASKPDEEIEIYIPYKT